jgi:hypothetical protein
LFIDAPHSAAIISQTPARINIRDTQSRRKYLRIE